MVPFSAIPGSDPEAQMLMIFRLSFSLLFEYQKRTTEVVYKRQSSRLRENVGHHMLAEDVNKIDPLIKVHVE